MSERMVVAYFARGVGRLCVFFIDGGEPCSVDELASASPYAGQPVLELLRRPNVIWVRLPSVFVMWGWAGA